MVRPLISWQAIALCCLAAGGVIFVQFKNISKMLNNEVKALPMQAQREYIYLPEGVQVRRSELVALQKLVTFLESDFHGERTYDKTNYAHLLAYDLADMHPEGLDNFKPGSFLLELHTLLSALLIGERGKKIAKPGENKVRRGMLSSLTTTHVAAWHAFKQAMKPEHPALELFRHICEHSIPDGDESFVNDLVCLHEYLMLLIPTRNCEVL